jgi:hypothetical protein
MLTPPRGTAATVTTQWVRCPDTGACVPIASATGDTYVVSAAGAGSRVRVRVTAVNAAGRDFTESTATAVVAALAPTADGFASLPADAAAAAPGAPAGSAAGTAVAPPDAEAATGASAAAVGAGEFPPDLIAGVHVLGRKVAPLGLRVSSARCSRRGCSASVTSSGPATTMRVVLRRGSSAVCWVRRGAASRPVQIALRPRARLRGGRYTVVTTVWGLAGATKTVRSAVTVR